MNGNEEPIEKFCPWLREPCIEHKCVQYIEVMQHQVTLGIQKASKAGMCVFPALAMIMSSKPQTPVPIKLLGLRGS